MIKISLRLLASLIVSMTVHPALHAPTPQPSVLAQPIMLVTRDAAGNGLQGIVIDIARIGPPDEPYGQCTTGKAGECQLSLPPSAYVLLFRTSWSGQPFIDPARQNAGPAEGAGELLSQGFAIQVDPSPDPITFLFVIGRDTSGDLVPLWDNAADRNADPQPYLAPGQAGNVQLNSLSGGGTSDIEPTAIPSRQVVVSSYSADATPTLVPVPGVQAAAGIPTDNLLPGLLGLGVIAVIVVALVLLGRYGRQGARNG